MGQQVRPPRPPGVRRMPPGWLVEMVLGMLVAALVAWLSLCVDLIAHPTVDARTPVDAVYVLGPVETRIDQTLAIMDTGVAPVLLATTSINAASGQAYATEHCGTRTQSYRVECLVPAPYSTRGEARLLAAQVREHGWTRVAVVTSTPHASRARLLMERCTDAEVLLWTYDGQQEQSLRDWVGAFIYQSAGWVKTQLDPGC